jgi:hypothetical protein
LNEVVHGRQANDALQSLIIFWHSLTLSVLFNLAGPS